MKSKKIYLVRHGQTDYNKKGIVQGSGIDAPLNEKGQQQASSFFQAYNHVAFDKIYISTLQRTQQSIQPFIDLGIPFEKLSGLNEIHWGEKEGKPFTKEDHDYYLSIIKGWENGQVELAIKGGESPVEVQNRQKQALQQILQNEDEQQILICMHGRAIRVFMCLLLNYHLKHMDIFPHNNLGLYKLNFTGYHFNVALTNDIDHLNGIANSSHNDSKIQ